MNKVFKKEPLMSKWTYERLVTKYIEENDPQLMCDPNFKGKYHDPDFCMDYDDITATDVAKTNFEKALLKELI